MRLGHGNLSGEPHEDNFDPMGETWWTLPMTVAWIAWRRPKFVRARWPEFSRNCWDWHYREWRLGPDVHSGHFLEQRREANLNMLRLSETIEALHELLPPNRIPVREAQTSVGPQAALGDGDAGSRTRWTAPS